MALNLGKETTSFDLPEEAKLGRIVASTDLNRQGMDVFEALEVRTNEGVVLQVG